jgi:hypothetical protein
MGLMGRMGLMGPMELMGLCLALLSCKPDPELHLYDSATIEIDMPMVKLDLETYWDYELIYGVYEWHAEWYYGWDVTDLQLFGDIGYSKPDAFMLRRYYTGSEPLAPHTSVLATTISGNSFHGQYNWGFWDILVWNDVATPDGVQSLNFDEQTSLDYVTAYTNQTMSPSRYQAPRYTRSFYQPEELFSAYMQAIEINRDLTGFEYDEVNKVYIKRLNLVLEPLTYIYLAEIILHNNQNKIVGVDGMGNISGMAHSTVLNSGLADNDPVTVYFNTRFKTNCNMDGESVDIAGGRLLTFGICGQNGNRITRREDVKDPNRHYLDMTMLFNNGMDSVFVFDVTEQVRDRWKGGVIRVELDMDTVHIPSRKGGSAFDAVVKDFEDGGTHEFDL